MPKGEPLPLDDATGYEPYEGGASCCGAKLPNPPYCCAGACCGGCWRKKAIGSCLGAVDEPKPGEGVGEGAEKRSSGRPEDDSPDPLDPAAALSVGSDKPPSPDIGASSSAKASKEMRSAAFLFGLALV